MMNRRLGFTLAEVLITLVIIGVIAAMTIPTLMQSTSGQEYRSGLKKAVSMLNQAVTMDYAIDGTTAADQTTQTNLVNNIFNERLSVISSTPASGIFYTADGMRFTIAAPTACDTNGSNLCANIVVDVNGDKGPNQTTPDATHPKDRYNLQLFAQRVVPGDSIAQTIMYNN